MAKEGKLLAGELKLGRQFKYSNGDDNSGSIYAEHGAYHVKGFDNGKHFNESFDKFIAAKKFYLAKQKTTRMAHGGSTNSKGRMVNLERGFTTLFPSGSYELIREIKGTSVIPEGQYEIKNSEGRLIILGKSRFTKSSENAIDYDAFDKSWGKFKASTRKSFGSKYAKGGRTPIDIENERVHLQEQYMDKYDTIEQKATKEAKELNKRISKLEDEYRYASELKIEKGSTGRYHILGGDKGQQPSLYASTNDRKSIAKIVKAAEKDISELIGGKESNVFVTDSKEDREIFNYDEGGKIVYVGDMPLNIDGREELTQKEAEKLAKHWEGKGHNNVTIEYFEKGGSMARGGEIKKGDKVKVLSDYGSGIDSVSKGMRGEVYSIDKSKDKTTHVIGSNNRQFWTPLSNLESLDSYSKGGSTARGGGIKLKDGTTISRVKYYKMMEEKIGFQKLAEKILKDSQFGNIKGTHKNEFKHNKEKHNAVIEKDYVELVGFATKDKSSFSKKFRSLRELDEFLQKNNIYAKGGEVKVGEKLSEHKFVSGTIYWKVPYAIFNGEKYEIGDTVYWLDKDDYIPMRGDIDWMMIDDKGNVEVSLKNEMADVEGNWEDSSWGRESIENIGKEDNHWEFSKGGSTERVVVYGTKTEVKEMYLDYKNNFLTVGRFAEYYGISNEKANRLIEIGREHAKNDGHYAKGGWVSKGEHVWAKLSSSDRAKFLHENFTPNITPRSQELLVGKTYNFLPKKVKIVVESKYANVDNYAKGGGVQAKQASVKSGYFEGGLSFLNY